jgi:hypothetical protein
MEFEQLLDNIKQIEALSTEYCLLCNCTLEDAFFNHESFEPLKIGELPDAMVGLNILGKFAGHYIIISQHVPDNNVLTYPMKYLFDFQPSGIEYFDMIIKKGMPVGTGEHHV